VFPPVHSFRLDESNFGPTGRQVGERNLTQQQTLLTGSITLSKHQACASSSVLPEYDVFTRLKCYKTEKNLSAPSAIAATASPMETRSVLITKS